MSETQGATPAPATSGTDTSTAATTTTTSNWVESIGDAETRAWAQAKGFHNVKVDDALNSYRNLEKVIGADKAGRTVVLPKGDDPNEVNAFYEKLGRPKDAADYKFPDKDVDADLVGWARQNFHEAGLTSKQAEALIGKWQAMVSGKTAAMAEAKGLQTKQEMESLQREWGAAYDDQVSKARGAAQAFGFDEATLNKLEGALGFAGLMKMFASLGARTGESRGLPEGSSSGGTGALTPQMATDRIALLKSDKDWVRRWAAGGVAEKEELSRLQSMAYGR